MLHIKQYFCLCTYITIYYNMDAGGRAGKYIVVAQYYDEYACFLFV